VVGPLAAWYDAHGRHDLAWRATRDRWSVLVSEVMLQQTQVTRVADAWPEFIGHFPTPAAAAAAGPGAVITAWGRLGYPRRARWLWEAAVIIESQGWPDDLTELPGVGRYTAGAIAAQADGVDVPAVEVNVRRVMERVEGRRLTVSEAEAAMMRVGSGLPGRDRLLALMDVGAVCCRLKDPNCRACPLRRRCASRGPRPGEHDERRRQSRFEGSFRQRRGRVLGALRAGSQPVASFDAEALSSLVADRLAIVDGDLARLPDERPVPMRS
jgi:A/G-specific adenine glycosylase